MTVNTEYTVNVEPCFFKPKRKSGTLSTRRKNDKDKYGGVICESKIDVPDIPLSYNFTGAKNTVTPKAFMQPARNKIIKFCHRNVFKNFFKIRYLHKSLG